MKNQKDKRVTMSMFEGWFVWLKC